MNPELQALLTVQRDDAAIREIEARLMALLPRFNTLDAACRRTAEEVARNEQVLEREGARLRLAEGTLGEHRVRLEKCMAVLDVASRLKEATAAAAQVEAARKAVAHGESEVLTMTRRVADLRTALSAHQEELERLTMEREAVRESIRIERDAIESELTAARAQRAMSAEGVGRSLLTMYDRVHTKRRTTVVYALHEDFSCGACDTAIPLQRRPAMSNGTRVEPCEACGVLLYYRRSEAASG